MDDIDTTNEHGVGVQGEMIVFLNPPTSIERDRALMLAAWIVALAEVRDGEFTAALDAVRAT